MVSSLSKLMLESMIIMVLLQISVLYAATIPLDTDFKMDQVKSVSSENEEPLNKEQFRQRMTRQLIVLQQAEADVMHRLRELEAERIALSQRKRSHYSTMCLFNVVTCFKKRR